MTRTPRARVILATLAVAALPACGDDDVGEIDAHDAARADSAAADAALVDATAADGGSADAEVPDAGPPDATLPEGDPPTAAVRFPPARSLTTIPEITIRGSASDASAVAAVVAGGIAATSSDGFATWSATVPLSPGDNAIVVESRDVWGNADLDAASVTVSYGAAPLTNRSREIALDASRGRAIVNSSYPEDALLAVDLATGTRTVFSGGAVGAGPALPVVGGIDWDATYDRALVATGIAPFQLMAIDGVAGDRTIVSGGTTGAGPAFGQLSGVAVAPGGTIAFVLQRAPAGLLRVDLATGVRTVVSNATTGEGMMFREPDDVAIESATSVVLVGVEEVFRVDLATGDRTKLNSVYLGWPSGVEVDAAGSRALVACANGDAVTAIDLATGIATPLADATHGAGVRLLDPYGLALDAAAGRALVLDGDLHAVVGVSLATGDRTSLSDSFVGQGEHFVWIEGPAGWGAHAWDDDLRRLVVTDVILDAAVGVELATSDRVVLASAEVGAGPELETPQSIDLYQLVAEPRALILDRYQGLYDVSLRDGNRTLISSLSGGAWPASAERVSVARDAARGRALVGDLYSSILFSVDLATGASAVFSGGGAGAGDPLCGPTDLLLEPGGASLLVASSCSSAVVAVDLATGDRSVVSSASTGSGGGPGLDHPRRLAPVDAARLLVADRQGIFLVSRATGDRTPVAGAGLGSGPPLPELAGLDYVADVRTILATGEPNAVYAIDLDSGDRVILSK